MELINNTSKTLRDDLSVEIRQGSKLSIAAACFSIYAFEELKKELKGIDENVTEETIKAIAQKKPYYFVMRDSSMANDSVATNFEQIFATYSPDTVRKVL